LDVSLGNKPQADLRRYHAKHRYEVVGGLLHLLEVRNTEGRRRFV
jgi:hypothetical protein